MNKYAYLQYMEKQAISPLTVLLSGATVGGATGTGLSLWNNDDMSHGALIGAGIGAIPGLLQALQQYYRSYKDISFNDAPGKIKWYEPLTLDPKKLSEKSKHYKANIDNLIQSTKSYNK